MSEMHKIKNLVNGTVYIEVEGRRRTLAPRQEIEVAKEDIAEATKVLVRDGIISISDSNGSVEAPKIAEEIEKKRKAELEENAEDSADISDTPDAEPTEEVSGEEPEKEEVKEDSEEEPTVEEPVVEEPVVEEPKEAPKAKAPRKKRKKGSE